MSTSVQVTVNQIGPSASEGTVREHTAFMDRPEAKGGERTAVPWGGAPVDGLGGYLLSECRAGLIGDCYKSFSFCAMSHP
jgi:hypothetical protein